LSGLIVLAVTFGLMWVLFILPRQRQLRAHQRLVATIEPGDEVVTGGGIYGTVTEVDAEVVRLEVSPGVQLRVARAAVLRRLDDASGADADDVSQEEGST
jgi:preprotein translocase subunit YajC